MFCIYDAKINNITNFGAFAEVCKNFFQLHSKGSTEGQHPIDEQVLEVSSRYLGG